MVYFLYILTPALAVALFAKYYWGKEITLKELCIAIGACIFASLILTMVTEATKYINMRDTEVLNGFVTSKARDVVDCEHSYDCNCVTVCSGSGSNQSCSTTCDTCYEHDFDVDWDVSTTVGDITIDRLDDQGLRKPPRWSIVKVGEPASKEHSYVNYLKGNEDSIFYVPKEELGTYKKLPKYPYVYDYYRSKKVRNMTKVDSRGFDEYIGERLKILGAQKQVNILVIITNEKSPKYFNAVVSNFGGVKKNDVLMVFGVDAKSKVSWYKSTSFADGMDNREMHILMRQEALNKKLDLHLLKLEIDLVEKHFTRLPNEKFEYLVENLDPPTWVVILNILLNIAITLFVSYQLAHNYERERK